MQRTAWRWAAAWCALVSVGSVPMAAQGAGSEGSGDGVLFPPAPTVYPGTREFQWTIRVPLLTIEQREFVFKAPTGITRPARWDYEGPAVRTERRKIGTYPEFTCKYLDWTVSNECRTVWRGVYADLPVIVMRPQHLVFDVPDWRWKSQMFPIGVVRWTWKEERWTVSVPVIVTDPNDDSRASAARPADGQCRPRARPDDARGERGRRARRARRWLARIGSEHRGGGILRRGSEPHRDRRRQHARLDRRARRASRRARRVGAAFSAYRRRARCRGERDPRNQRLRRRVFRRGERKKKTRRTWRVFGSRR